MKWWFKNDRQFTFSIQINRLINEVLELSHSILIINNLIMTGFKYFNSLYAYIFTK